MSVKRRVRDGTTTYRVRWRDPSGNQRSKSFPSRRAADAWDAQHRADRARGVLVDERAGAISVQEWSETWLAAMGGKPTAVASRRSLAKRVVDRWGTTPLRAVAHADVAVWVRDLEKEGLSASRVRQCYHALTSMLDMAVRDRRLAANQAAGVTLPRLTSAERRYLTHTEVSRLAHEAGDDATVVYVLAYCGPRWSEVAGLKVGRVRPDGKRFDVHEAVTEADGEQHTGPPKTHARRTVVVPAFVAHRLAEVVRDRGTDEYVFPDVSGGPLRVGTFRRSVFDAAAERAGLTGLTPHELRHTAASLAISAGASVKGVQAMLGHASAAMTLDRYGHLFPDDLDSVAEALDHAAALECGPKVVPASSGPTQYGKSQAL